MTIRLEFDALVVECGGRFTGRVTRDPDADGVTTDSRARSVRLTLRYRTEGRGDNESKKITVVNFDVETHGGLSVPFSLPVPMGSPISYDGSLMRVIYEVEARVDIKLARDPKIKRLVLVVPEGGGWVYDRPHPLPMQPGEF
jgi:sporulation-control protein spo0M